VIEKRNLYPIRIGSNLTYDMFTLHESIVVRVLLELIVDGGWQGTNYLILTYGLQGGMNCIPMKKKYNSNIYYGIH